MITTRAPDGANKRAQKSNFHFSFTNTDWRKNFPWKRCMQSIFHPTFLLLFFPLLTYPLLRRLLRIFYSSNQSLNQSFANSQDFTHICSKEQYCLANTNKFQCSNEIFEYIWISLYKYEHYISGKWIFYLRENFDEKTDSLCTKGI